MYPRKNFKLLSIQFDQSLVLERGIIFVVIDDVFRVGISISFLYSLYIVQVGHEWKQGVVEKKMKRSKEHGSTINCIITLWF